MGKVGKKGRMRAGRKGSTKTENNTKPIAATTESSCRTPLPKKTLERIYTTNDATRRSPPNHERGKQEMGAGKRGYRRQPLPGLQVDTGVPAGT